MTDIFLYQGEANPHDVKLTDPTVLAGGGPAEYTLEADAGAFALAGQNASLLADFRLDCASGAFALSGSHADSFGGELGAGELGAIELGSLAAEGDVTFRVGYVLQTAAASFALAGTDATLTYAPMSAPTPVFSSGWPVTSYLAHYTLHVDAGQFALDGQPATLLRGSRLVTEAQALPPVSTADLHVGRTLATDALAFTWTGDSSVLVDRYASMQPGSFGLAGQNAVLTHQTDTVGKAWLALQREIDDEDELLLLGVFDR